MYRPPRRVARILGYTLFALGGLAAIIWPSPAVARATGWLVYVWAAWLVLGGSCSMIGAVTDRWLGEYVGLPLLFSAFGVYGAVVASSGRLASSAGAMVLVAIALILGARWQDIGWVRREAARSAEHRQG